MTRWRSSPDASSHWRSILVSAWCLPTAIRNALWAAVTRAVMGLEACATEWCATECAFAFTWSVFIWCSQASIPLVHMIHRRNWLAHIDLANWATETLTDDFG